MKKLSIVSLICLAAMLLGSTGSALATSIDTIYFDFHNFVNNQGNRLSGVLTLRFCTYAQATGSEALDSTYLDVGIDNAQNLLGELRPFSFDEILHFVKLNSSMKLWTSIVQKAAQKDCHRQREE